MLRKSGKYLKIQPYQLSAVGISVNYYVTCNTKNIHKSGYNRTILTTRHSTTSNMITDSKDSGVRKRAKTASKSLRKEKSAMHDKLIDYADYYF
jgi:hypothetical protein